MEIWILNFAVSCMVIMALSAIILMIACKAAKDFIEEDDENGMDDE